MALTEGNQHPLRARLESAHVICRKKSPVEVGSRAKGTERAMQRSVRLHVASRAPRPCQRMHLYVAKDIRGCQQLLDHLPGRIASGVASWRKNVRSFYLRDYGDRGPDSQVVNRRLSNNVPAGLTPACRKGNHHAILVDFPNDAETCRVWSGFGGHEPISLRPESRTRATGAFATGSLTAAVSKGISCRFISV